MAEGGTLTVKVLAGKVDGSGPVVNDKLLPVFTKVVPLYSSQCIRYSVFGYIPAIYTFALFVEHGTRLVVIELGLSVPVRSPVESGQATDGRPRTAAH